MTDRFNTIAGWALFAGIVALGLSALSARIFHADRPEAPEQPGYFIEAADDGTAADAGPPLALLLAEGSVEAGEASFAKCIACHTIDQGGATGIGPNLWGTLGTPIGAHAAGFAYSSALASVDGTWDYENMDAWLASPRAFASGTKMSFAGLSNPEERANVILYMRAHGGGPPLPDVPEPEPADESAEGDPVAGEETPMEAVGGTGASQPVASSNPAPAAGESAPTSE